MRAEVLSRIRDVFSLTPRFSWCFPESVAAKRKHELDGDSISRMLDFCTYNCYTQIWV